MRNAFASEITKLAAEVPELVLLAGDIGNHLFDEFKEKFPNRFYNCGVAEANMTSMAAGLAMSGMRPITYTIAAFNTARCLEQIRVDLAYHCLPVVVVGVGAGLSYAELGGTHQCCEDIGFLRTIPGMSVVCPADSHEVKGLLRSTLNSTGPVYFRLGKKGEPDVHTETIPDLRIGTPAQLKTGKKVCILAVGNMVHTALQSAEKLEKEGIQPTVVSWHTVKPLNTPYLETLLKEHSFIVTIEEHSKASGFGSSVAEWFVDLRIHEKWKGSLLRFGTEDRFFHEAGKQGHFRARHGLTSDAITLAILKEVSNDRR